MFTWLVDLWYNEFYDQLKTSDDYSDRKEDSMKDNVIVGFEFEDEISSRMAKQELDKILKLKERYNIKNAATKLEFYNKLIDEKVFKTPVGMEYLRGIQKELYENKEIDNAEIRSIPAIIYQESDGKVLQNTRKNNLNYNGKQKDKKAEKYKDLYIKMLIVNAVLIVTIIVMFVITKNSEKYDLDYYRESVENEYIEWEQNLQERESALAESEK